MWHCLKDPFAYCTGSPDGIDAEATQVSYDYKGVAHYTPTTIETCTLDPKTCGKSLSFADSIEKYKRQHPGRIPVSLK